MLIDIHTHTERYSGCGRSAPEDMVAAAQRAGLDGIVITEHDMVWPDDEIAALREQFPEMLVLRAIEVTVASTDHVLVYGLRDWKTIRWHTPADELLRIVNEQGAAAVLAHPYRYGDTVPEAIAPGNIQGVEVMSKNIHGYNHSRAVDLAARLGVPVTGGSDGHHVDQIGLYALRFGEDIADEFQLAKAIREGTFAPHIDHERVSARNAWLDGLLPEIDAMMAEGRDNHAIHDRFPEITYTILEHHRLGVDVHWIDRAPATVRQPAP